MMRVAFVAWQGQWVAAARQRQSMFKAQHTINKLLLQTLLHAFEWWSDLALRMRMANVACAHAITSNRAQSKDNDLEVLYCVCQSFSQLATVRSTAFTSWSHHQEGHVKSVPCKSVLDLQLLDCFSPPDQRIETRIRTSDIGSSSWKGSVQLLSLEL
jgi:hypothetical protein